MTIYPRYRNYADISWISAALTLCLLRGIFEKFRGIALREYWLVAVAMLLLPFLLLLTDGSDAIQIFSQLSAVPSAVPAACASALTANITCQQLIPASYISAQRALNNATLTGLCTTTCSSSLFHFQQQVDTACGTETYPFGSNINQTVQQFVAPLVWAYNVSCLTSGSTFCLPELTNASIPISQCSDCALLYGAAMLDSVYGRVRIDPGSFSSILSSCDVPASSFPYTNPPTSTATTTASTTSATCSGSLYKVQSTDTCNSIALANKIATDRFLTQNNLDYNCTNLIPGNEVCLGASCALHQVTANDTCDSILENENFYLVQFLSWNPTIHSNCDNLDSMVERDICISPPGSSKWDVVPENFTSSWNVTFIVPSTSFTSIPVQTAQPTYNTTWYAPTTTLNISTTTFVINITQMTILASLTEDCPISNNDTADGWTFWELLDYCNDTDALTEYCLPSINATMPPSTSFPLTCSPSYWDNLSAAATTSGTATTIPSPSALKQTGIAANCDAFYVVQSDDTCQGIVDKYGNFTLAQFYSWNPAVGSSCSFLDPTYAVCVGVSGTLTSKTTTNTATKTTSSGPSPIEPSTDPSCTAYHYVISGDGCSKIEEEYDITADQFNAWNPGVGASCLYLDLNEYVCVGAPYPVSTSTTAPTTTAPPAPLESSTDPKCTAYHLVASGDTCGALETKYDITAAQFNAWNLHVGATCEYLDLNEYVCVAAPS